ncbi:MAG TPA: DNA-directed RNA polymerase subunit omega [Clostridiaceae bacterium]|nr:DNA-directed RNA polymerase subunit omega [Clostridiaceae bacterium]
MLTEPSIEELLPKAENRYVLAMLTAKRARQLVDGAQPMVNQKTDNFVSLAAEEIKEDQVKAVKGQHDIKVPLRPEVEAARLNAELEAEAKRREVQHAENKRNAERVQARERVLERAQFAEDEKEVNKNLAEQFLRLVNENAGFGNNAQDED